MTVRKRKKTDDLSHIVEGLRPLAVAVDELVEDPANARTHSRRNIETIKVSLVRFGQRKPIVVNRNGNVIEAGNGTFAAAKALNWNHIAAVLVDDDPTTAAGFAIADNRTAELAEWNYEVLVDTINSIKTVDELMAVDLGFSANDLDTLLGTTWTPPENPEPPKEREPKRVVKFNKEQWETITRLGPEKDLAESLTTVVGDVLSEDED